MKVVSRNVLLGQGKCFIVPYASALFTMNEGQARAIPMRQEAKKKRVLPALQLIENREVGYIAILKRDEGTKGVVPPTSPGSWHK